MFSKATYVITSTFHGLMVGLNYRKQIKYCHTDFVVNSSKTLIEILGIPDFNKDFERDLDYKVISEKLKGLRNQSIGFLKDTICY